MAIARMLLLGHLASVKMMWFSELFDKSATAPGGGARGARGGRGHRGHHGAQRGHQAGVWSATSFIATQDINSPSIRTVPQVGVGAVQLKLSLRK